MFHRVNMMLQNATRRLPSFFTVQIFKRVCSLIHVLHVTLKSRFGDVRCERFAWCLQCWKMRKLKKNREKKNPQICLHRLFVVGNCVECNQQKIVSECEPGLKKKIRGWSLLEAGHSFETEVKKCIAFTYVIEPGLLRSFLVSRQRQKSTLT